MHFRDFHHSAVPCTHFVAMAGGDSGSFIGVGRHKLLFIQVQSQIVLHEMIILLLDKLLKISFTIRR